MAGVRARRKAERPRQILDAAFDEFVENGYAGARLEDAAARIGVTKGTIYFYFPTKERVFEAALQAVAEDAWSELARQPIAATDDLIADVRSFLERLHRSVIDNPRARESFRLLVAEGHRFPALVDLYFRSFMSPVESVLRERLDRAGREGRLQADLAHLPEVILSPPLALQVMMLLFPDRLPVDRRLFLQSHVAVLSAGILASRTPPAARGPTGGAWSDWRACPDPHRGEALTAPVGPGLFELRLTGGDLLLVDAARSVAGRMAALVMVGPSRRPRDDRSPRGFLERHIHEIEYRTLPCPTLAEAKALARSLPPDVYRFQGIRDGIE